jgi:4-amino-4-deoxy-L-arabinose transferase-like glycosyltransferase
MCRAAGAGDRLGVDEGYSWLVGSAPGGGAFLHRLASYENTPPLFYLLLTPLPLRDEVWIRLPALVAGVASVPVLYAVIRPLLGARTALLAALGLAVAPYHVASSDFARGFTLATLGMLLALWAAARLVQGRPRRWWWLYGLGALVAIWSEYYAGLFLLALIGALLALRARPAREVLALGLAPFLTLLPWLPQLHRSIELEGRTKVLPRSPALTPGVVRDALVPLVFGQHGSAASPGVRTVQLSAVLVAAAGAGLLLRRRRDAGSRIALWLLGAVALVTLALHFAGALSGPGIFETRYLTGLIPLVAALLAAGVAVLRWRAAAPLAALALVGLGVAVVVERAGRELEPDYARVARTVRAARTRTVLTNSAVVRFYLPGATLDRPFNLGPGRERDTSPPYAVVDDDRVGRGARPGRGRIVADVGGVVVRIVRR